jgi:hypothetical protein
MINYGTLCGLCPDYYLNEIKIEQSKVTLSAYSQDKEKYPQRQCQKSIIIEKWYKLVNFVDSISFNKLDTTYFSSPACEDCVIEWVEVITSEGKHKVSVEYDHRPEVMEGLTNTLRDLKETLKGCE